MYKSHVIGYYNTANTFGIDERTTVHYWPLHNLVGCRVGGDGRYCEAAPVLSDHDLDGLPAFACL